MKNSDEIKKLEELPKVDYTKLPEEIEDAIAKEAYEVDEKVKLTWDGKQFIVRIPSEITKEYHITKENRMWFHLTKPLPDSKGKPELKIELV